MSAMTSSSGSSLARWMLGPHSPIWKMSWPVPARASACAVSASLLPTLVMKSTLTSTLFRRPQSVQIRSTTGLTPGTQWSCTPSSSRPAECARLT